ncbi:MAG: GAF domain-containing protein [Proteobacteria bacterium]|nr:GAF domain-containing protein [Pseudomonadota bacterium]
MRNLIARKHLSWSGVVGGRIARVCLRSISLFLFLMPAALARADSTAASVSGSNLPEYGLPFIRNFDPSEYGAGAQNWAFAQDAQGVIYVGNGDDGVLVFDGARWQRIAIPNLSIVRSLAADADGRVYVGAVGELGYLAPDAAGQLRYVSLLDRIPAGNRDFADVWRVFATDQGVFFHTGKYLFRIRGKDVTVWPSATSFHLVFWVRHSLYVREVGKGLMRLDGDRLALVPGGDRFASEKIYALLPWGDTGAGSGDLLIGTRTQGWFIFDGTRYQPWRTEGDAILKRAQLEDASWLANGTLAIATLQNGVIQLDTNGRLLRHLTKTNGLADNVVYKLFEDRQRGLWLALDTGISRVDLGSPLSRFDDRTGLPGALLALQRHAGRLYAGTTLGLFRLDSDAEGGARFDQITQVPSDSWALLDTGDALLVGTHAGVFEIRGGHVKLVRASERISETLLRSRRDPARVFIGLQDGLASMRLEGDRWVDEGRVPGITEETRTLFEESDGRLWLGSIDGGAMRVTFPRAWAGTKAGGEPVRVERFDAVHGLPIGWTMVWSIDGMPRFTSASGGLFRFDESTRRFSEDPRFASLFPAGPRAMLPVVDDATRRVWMEADDPLGRTQEVGAAVIGEKGMYRWETTPLQPISGSHIQAIHCDSDGVVWFGGARGLFRYDSRIPARDNSGFNALIRAVTAHDGQRIFSAGNTMPQVAFAHNSLRVGFAATSFNFLEANRFQVLLDGLDRNWSTWSSETYRDYTNLPEGVYRFRVRARDVYGNTSAEAVSAFRILPPWYRTWWAELLMAGAGLMAIVAFVQARTLRLRRRQRDLERQIDARTAEVVRQKEIVENRNREVELQRVAAEQQKAIAELAHRNIALLSEIGRLITASLDPEAIMQTLYEHVDKLMDASVFGVGLYDEENALIRIPFAMELGKRMVAYSRRMDEPNQLAVWCIANRKDVFINNLAAEARRYTGDAEKASARLTGIPLADGSPRNTPVAMIYVPLLVKDRVLGMICVLSFRTHAYAPVHLDMLRTLAAYTAIALDNAEASVELERAQKQLFQQESMASLGRLVAGVAHEINTPLGIGVTAASHLDTVVAAIDSSLRDAQIVDLRKELEDARDCIELVLNNLGRAAHLVKSFKQVAVDQSTETRRRVAVRDYLDDVVTSLGPRLRATAHRIEVECAPDLEIDTYPGALYQIVANMVLNSLTHAFEGVAAGWIRIVARRTGDNLELRCADNGRGMTEDVRARVFDPFFTTRQGSGGTGLGLHLVYNLVHQLLRGVIECESSPGQGTTFVIRIPLVEGDIAPAALPGASAGVTRPEASNVARESFP